MRTIDTISSPLYPLGGFARRLRLAFDKLGSGFAQAAMRRSTRVALLELTDPQLLDIGISPADARREGIRPFWE